MFGLNIDREILANGHTPLL